MSDAKKLDEVSDSQEQTNQNAETSNASETTTEVNKEENSPYKLAVTWLLTAAPQSPSDVWVELKENKKFIKIQNRGANTRKSLLQQLLDKGVFELHIPSEQFRYFLEYSEQFVQSNYAAEKVGEFFTDDKYYNLLMPRTIAYPFQIQKILKEVKVLGDSFDRSNFKLPEYPKDIDIIELLYNDIDLYSETTEEAELGNREELKKLESLNEDLKHQLSQYKEKLKDIKTYADKKESETKKANDELYKVQGDLTKITDDYQELMRKFKITKTDLDDFLSGEKDVKEYFQKKLDNLESKLQEVRREGQDFKIKYAREMERTKNLEKELKQAQSTLNKTALALKKVTDKKS